MRLVSATLYEMAIPFVESFRHSTNNRTMCDSVVVKVSDDTGIRGYGEGAPRPYVTGETVQSMLNHLANELWPAVAEREVPSVLSEGELGLLDGHIGPSIGGDHQASRAALELAILDCVLRRAGLSATQILLPRRDKVIYSGVLTAGPLDKTLALGRQMKLIGLNQIKIKVGLGDDLARVRAIRELFGPEASLRVDANGAWSYEEAKQMLEDLAALQIAAVEQPLRRGPVAELRQLHATSPLPIVVDESLVTMDDAEALIAERAADYFNIRVSKCGGLHRSLELARRANEAGIKVQVGSQAGETAILSAAGRLLAVAVEDLSFAEGSYGTLLLTEDVSFEAVRFGHRGLARPMRGPGLGVTVLEERLTAYARSVLELGRDGPLRS